MSLSEVKKIEAAGRLMYASPLSPDELELVGMPDGRQATAIRPAIPSSWDFKLRRFVEHSDRPVVCAATLARMVVMRGLAHPANHPELSRMEQCNGWVYEEEDGQPIGLPYQAATAEVHAAISQKGDRVRAWVYDLGDPGTSFSRFPSQLHQYRSEMPIEFQDAFEITGSNWPEGIAIMLHYDNYSSMEEWRSALSGRIGPLLRTG
jgi:hypothetical protein